MKAARLFTAAAGTILFGAALTAQPATELPVPNDGFSLTPGGAPLTLTLSFSSNACTADGYLVHVGVQGDIIMSNPGGAAPAEVADRYHTEIQPILRQDLNPVIKKLKAADLPATLSDPRTIRSSGILTKISKDDNASGHFSIAMAVVPDFFKRELPAMLNNRTDKLHLDYALSPTPVPACAVPAP